MICCKTYSDVDLRSTYRKGAFNNSISNLKWLFIYLFNTDVIGNVLGIQCVINLFHY